MWVIFEGLDKSGKGTLEWEFLKATNFKHIVIDRGPAGYLTFDCMFDRLTEEGNMQYAKNVVTMVMGGDFMVVYCKAPLDVALQRLKEHGEFCPYNYAMAQEIYDSVIERFYERNKIKVVTIDTSKPVDECVKKIIEKLKE